MSRVSKRLDDFKLNVTTTTTTTTTKVPNTNEIDFVFEDSSRNQDERSIYLRPPTARSLPTPNTANDESDIISLDTNGGDNASLSRTSFLNVDNSGRARNLSYPSINSLPPQPHNSSNARLITVVASSRTTADNSTSQLDDDDDEDMMTKTSAINIENTATPKKKPSTRKNSRLTVSSTATTSTASDSSTNQSMSPISPKNTNIVINNSTTPTKSNLDYFLDYSRNPFTTKYEIIGKTSQPTKNTNYNRPPKPKSNINLKELDSTDPNALVRRSASISNLGEKPTLSGRNNANNGNDQEKQRQLQVDMIISPNLIKPSYEATSPTMNKASTQRNNSSSNLFPIQPYSSLSEKRRVQTVSNDLKSRMSSISDENLAANSNAYRNKFKLTNRNGLISNNQLVRISDWVYCGNLNSVRNERALCQLGIEYVIDMSNMRPDDLTRAQTLGKLPCSCKGKQHSRLYLTIELRETNFKALFGAFGEVNKFIQQAKTSTGAVSESGQPQRRVLIFGREGLGSDQVRCACAQYLMVDCNMKLIKALNVLQAKSKGSMQKCYLEYLTQFEEYLDHMSRNISSIYRNDDVGGVNDDDLDEDIDEYELEYDNELEDEELSRHEAAKASKRSNNSGHHNNHHNHHHHHHHHNSSNNANDLQLDNLSDLSDNFTSAPTIPLHKSSSATPKLGSSSFVAASFNHSSSIESDKPSLRAAAGASGGSGSGSGSKAAVSSGAASRNNKLETRRVAQNNSFKMAWM